MKVVLQRVCQASVTIEQQVTASINVGFVLLVGVQTGDTQAEADYLAKKIAHLRVFEDQEQKMNKNILQVQGEVLSISQFTLLGSTKKGNRPNFMQAEKPVRAKSLYDYFNEQLRNYGVRVATGEFGADMDVSLVNNGPVTIVLDTNDK